MPTKTSKSEILTKFDSLVTMGKKRKRSNTHWLGKAYRSWSTGRLVLAVELNASCIWKWKNACNVVNVGILLHRIQYFLLIIDKSWMWVIFKFCALYWIKTKECVYISIWSPYTLFGKKTPDTEWSRSSKYWHNSGDRIPLICAALHFTP